MSVYVFCRDCDDTANSPPTALPFVSSRTGAQWASTHEDATGHHRWVVVDRLPAA